MNNYNTNSSATVNLYYKGADYVQKNFTLNDTYYFSGIASNSTWTIQDYIPPFKTLADLSFKDIVYSNCNSIYSDINPLNKFWPSLCNSHYVSSTMKRCKTCVSNSTPIGYSCKCNYGHYEKILNNSCTPTSPIIVSLTLINQLPVKPLALVISNPCDIDSTSYCNENGQSRYLAKTRHIIFKSYPVNSSDTVTTYINDSRITTYETNGTVASYTE
jgi:hypothetical protein